LKTLEKKTKANHEQQPNVAQTNDITYQLIQPCGEEEEQHDHEDWR
jgi:hypothetical protein